MKKFFLMVALALVSVLPLMASDWEHLTDFELTVPISKLNCDVDFGYISFEADSKGIGAGFMSRHISSGSNFAVMFGMDLSYLSSDVSLKEFEQNSVSLKGMNLLCDFGLGGCFINNDKVKLIGSAVLGTTYMKFENNVIDNTEVNANVGGIFVGADIYIRSKLQNKIGFFVDATVGYNFMGFGSVDMIIESSEYNYSKHRYETYKENDSYPIETMSGIVFIPRMGLSIQF